MLRGCMKTVGQILHVVLTPFAVGFLEHSWNFLGKQGDINWFFWWPLPAFLEGNIMLLEYMSACSPEMTLIWLGTPEWLKSAVVEHSRPKAVLTYSRVRHRASWIFWRQLVPRNKLLFKWPVINLRLDTRSAPVFLSGLTFLGWKPFCPWKGAKWFVLPLESDNL